MNTFIDRVYTFAYIPFLTTPTTTSYTPKANTAANTTYYASTIRIIDVSSAELPRLKSSIPSKRPLTEQEFMEQQYREGKLLNLPVPQPLTEEEQAERERLAQVFAGGKPMSEMIIEDRGPY
jgi:hypothetical protein